jgi:hypothetical protein
MRTALLAAVDRHLSAGTVDDAVHPLYALAFALFDVAPASARTRVSTVLFLPARTVTDARARHERRPRT